MIRRSLPLLYIFTCFCVFIFVNLGGCNYKQRNVYDERDYILVKVDSFDGKIDAGNYVYKYDSTRKMRINYFYDGKILCNGFTHLGKLDGRLQTYEYSGKLIEIDSFHEGVLIHSQNFHKVDTSMRALKDGKLYAPDSTGAFHKVEN